MLNERLCAFSKGAFPLQKLVSRALWRMNLHSPDRVQNLAASLKLSGSAWFLSLKPDHVTCDTGPACCSKVCLQLKGCLSFLSFTHVLRLEEFQAAILFPHLQSGLWRVIQWHDRGKPVIPVGGDHLKSAQLGTW